MKETWKEAVHRQRTSLAEYLKTPLSKLATQCAQAWGQREELDIVLKDNFSTVPCCMFLYAVDTDGIQISDNISHGGLLPEHYGRDRSQRPYMREDEKNDPKEGVFHGAYLCLVLMGQPGL